MKNLQMPKRTSYTFAEKSRAFLRGFLAGKPLVEVARAGLTHDISEEQRTAYARRISRANDSESAFLALRDGAGSESAESILAPVIGNPDHAFNLLIGRRLSSGKAEAILAKKLVSEDSGFLCFLLLKLQTVRSHEAQDALAHMVKQDNLSDRAAELLLNGSVDSEIAQIKISAIVPPDQATIARIILRGKVAREALAELSKRMPPVCVPLDACKPAE
jgi:hypothetical protein